MLRIDQLIGHCMYSQLSLWHLRAIRRNRYRWSRRMWRTEEALFPLPGLVRSMSSYYLTVPWKGVVFDHVSYRALLFAVIHFWQGNSVKLNDTCYCCREVRTRLVGFISNKLRSPLPREIILEYTACRIRTNVQ
jgi:hypothetical protein